MERKISVNRCCCCGETLPSEFCFSIGNFLRVCVDCGYEINNAVKKRKEMFEDKPPILAVVKRGDVCTRSAMAEEAADSYFENVAGDAECMRVELTKEQLELISAEANAQFEANPMFHNAYADHYEIAQWMAINSTGSETDADMRKLLIDAWTAVSKDRLDRAYEICDGRDLSDPDDRYDISNALWVPFPSEDAALFLFDKLICRDDIKRARANNAEWQAKQKSQTEDEE